MTLDCIIVEDDRTSRMALTHLVNKNFKLNLLAVAENGADALELTRKHRPDLVLLDVSMPEMDGFEFLDQLENPDELNVILVTAEKEYALKAFEYNIVDYLLKPVSWHRLDQAVDRVINTITSGYRKGEMSNYLLLKLLRFMHTREIEVLEPKPSRESLLGYTYTLLTDHLDFSQQRYALEVLEEAEKAELLSASFVDIIYLCNNCSNSYLTLRESCPSCKSTYLQMSDFVHHFSCAYVGREEEFRNNGEGQKLVCPKCSDELKHIGVDYDKPSSIFNCRNCDNLFQEPMMRAKCNHCGSDTRVEHLERHILKKYRMTARGMELAEGNTELPAKPRVEPSSILDQNKSYFERIVKNEIARKKRAEFESTLGVISLRNIEELYRDIGKMSRQKLLAELFDILTNRLATSGELCFFDPDTILFLFPEKGTAASKSIIGELDQRIVHLINDNFEGFTLRTDQALTTIRGDMDYNAHIRSLLAKIDKNVP
ncbi:MAG: response regulator [Balneolaceae bacterium]|nr:response regulator [Balneolaceae bacterium]